MLFKPGNWNIEGSYGQTGSVGTPNIQVKLSGGTLNLPVKNSKTNQQAVVSGAGIGFAVGLSMEFPLSDVLNYTISTEEMPSTGIGPIFVKNGEPGQNPYKLEDLGGFATVLSGAGGAAATNGALSIIFWEKYAVESCFENVKTCNIFSAVAETGLMLNPGTMSLAWINAIHAIGFFTGIEATTDIANVGASLHKYRLWT